MNVIEFIEIIINALSAAAAARAAYQWYDASKLEIPLHTGDPWKGEGPFTRAIRLQSEMNATAAKYAAAAALLQTLAIIIRLLATIKLGHYLSAGMSG